MAENEQAQSWFRIAVVGCGQMGMSIASLLRAHGVAEEVVGTDKSEMNLEMARRMGCLDRTEAKLDRAVIGATVIVLALPLDEVFSAMQALGPDVRPGTLITCTAGTTARLHAQLVRHVRSAENFVPAYPLIWSAGAGPGTASADLLQGKKCLLASGEHVSERALEQAVNFWKAVGLHPDVLPADRFEASIAGHAFWPLTVGLAASKVASRENWPVADTALTRWLEVVGSSMENPERSMQLYSSRLCGLLAETIEELQIWHRRLGGANDDPEPEDQDMPQVQDEEKKET